MQPKQYEKMVVAQFDYIDPDTGKTFVVAQAWPCWDEADAELTVRYHGFKTGAIEAKCNIEDIRYEEVQSPA